MIGILASMQFNNDSYGDTHLTKRPMDRVITPLNQMGAQISGRQSGSYLPLSTEAASLEGIHYEIPVKSAQVKSAILLAGLFAKGETTVVEQAATRDHTENMLKAYVAEITRYGLTHTESNAET